MLLLCSLESWHVCMHISRPAVHVALLACAVFTFKVSCTKVHHLGTVAFAWQRPGRLLPICITNENSGTVTPTVYGAVACTRHVADCIQVHCAFSCMVRVHPTCASWYCTQLPRAQLGLFTTLVDAASLLTAGHTCMNEMAVIYMEVLRIL